MGPLGHSLAALAGLCALPVAAGAWLTSSRWREGFGERLGARREVPRDAIWIHAASVGEIRAALPLVDALRNRNVPVTTSTMTVTGRDLARRERPDVACYLAPIDHPWIIARALRATRPRALVFVETELWPCWIRGASERGIPVLSVSARLSSRSAGRYKVVGPWVGSLLRRFTAIGTRSADDAERFASLGASPDRVTVTGDLKEAAGASPQPLDDALLSVLGEVPLVVAGSTHEGEERAALEAFSAQQSRAALLLAPRHVERFSAVVDLVRDRGFPVRRRSALAQGAPPLREGEVLVLDSLGELAAVYSHAAAVFLGGSLVPRGGHNPWEVARAGAPIVVGPHTENIRAMLEPLRSAGAATEVADAAALGRELELLLGNLEDARSRGERGRREAQRRSGDVAEATASWVMAELAR